MDLGSWARRAISETPMAGWCGEKQLNSANALAAELDESGSGW
ncbi:Uncharacterised protein [Mycobacteroides abscessus subsp. abscessus]|nr:Uncharacterised protein [Mycobacteroides abscessus subsp. abscessus]